MKKLLFSVCSALAILGCGGENVDELPPFDGRKDGGGVSNSYVYCRYYGDCEYMSVSDCNYYGGTNYGSDNTCGISSIVRCPNLSVYSNSLYCGGQTYRTVNINGRVWMAENLNYNPGGGTSACYGNNSANCTQYGRLYDWSTANGVCPTGWHLPSDAEWTALTNFVESYSGCSSCAGTKLKSETGWYYDYGEDAFGFSALPGGNGNSDGYFHSVGYNGYWWSATEYYSYDAWLRNMYYGSSVNRNLNSKSSLFSVRCLQD